MNASRTAAALLPVLLLAVVSSLGCTAVFPGLGSQNQDLSASQATCTVEMRSGSGSSKMKEIAVTPESHLQDIAEASGAARRFGRMDGYILRMGENGRRFQMEAAWDASARRFAMHTDYAVQPGDRVVFIEDNSTMVDNVLNTLLGPWASQ